MLENLQSLPSYTHCKLLKNLAKFLGYDIRKNETWSIYIVGILGSSESRGDTAATVPSPGNPRHVSFVRREKHSSSWDRDLIYESKRRVPNGPDPIHNRHIGETRRPSGRV